MASPAPTTDKNGAGPSARNIWDPKTQEEHGGQTWQQLGDRFVCDFSVTTNTLGTPVEALSQARKSLGDISHYPPADCEQAITALSKFTDFDATRILISNGASEMIELLMRAVPKGPFAHTPYSAGYMEYVRAARVAGRKQVKSSTEAAVSVIIRPNSPTGHFMSLDDLSEYIQNAMGVVVVDESFMAFRGPSWRKESALELIDVYPDKLIVLFSWTKLWCCPGIRLGSVSASSEWISRIKAMQTPWSCNTVAQVFLTEVCKDDAYLKKTWTVLPAWKKEQEERVSRLGWKINLDSPAWVPWVFFECPDEETAQRATDVAFQAGCPVRNCRSFGIPKCIRLGVREPRHQMVLQKAWEKEFLN